MIVTYDTYIAEKNAFFAKHKHDFECDTSPLDEYNCYHKTYIFADHAVWYECFTPCYVKYTAEVNKVKIDGEIKMLETEYWSTDNAKSHKYYEKY